MRRDKAVLVFRGRPLWQRQLELLRDLRPEKIFVSARTKPSWLPNDAELILDDPPSRGPLSGLTRAMEQVQTSHLIALAVDMPFMTREQMRVHCSLVNEGYGVVPVIGERTEPLAAIYPRGAAPDFAVTLAGNDFSLQGLARRLIAAGKLQPFAVPENDELLYRSVNAPGDL